MFAVPIQTLQTRGQPRLDCILYFSFPASEELQKLQSNHNTKLVYVSKNFNYVSEIQNT